LLSSGRTPRLLLRLSKSLRRPQPVVREAAPDRAWHEMLARLDAEEAERRLDATAAALDARARR